jgi:hypothetical protein
MASEAQHGAIFESLEAHSGIVEAYPVIIEAHSGALKVFPVEWSQRRG